MGKRDPRVDAYIAKSAEFAKPILQHLREVVHGACPEAEETVKWGMPHFLHEGILCHMAAFKAHCAFGFYKSALLFDDTPKQKEAMGDMGRITSVADLPPKKELVRLVRAARRLNEERIAAPRTTSIACSRRSSGARSTTPNDCRGARPPAGRPSLTPATPRPHHLPWPSSTRPPAIARPPDLTPAAPNPRCP